MINKNEAQNNQITNLTGCINKTKSLLTTLSVSFDNPVVFSSTLLSVLRLHDISVTGMEFGNAVPGSYEQNIPSGLPPVVSLDPSPPVIGSPSLAISSTSSMDRYET